MPLIEAEDKLKLEEIPVKLHRILRPTQGLRTLSRREFASPHNIRRSEEVFEADREFKQRRK